MGWKGNEDGKPNQKDRDLISNLRTLLKKPITENNVYAVNDCIMTSNITELWISIACSRVRPILKPMLQEQVRALEEFMDGKSYEMCRRRNCTRVNCFRAHGPEELISGVGEAIRNINRRIATMDLPAPIKCSKQKT